jgi:hypothetical protein
MSSDADGVVGQIKGRAKAALDQFMQGDTRGDADPDIEYEPAPEQRVLNDGMVVLSESQTQSANATEEGDPEDGGAGAPAG